MKLVIFFITHLVILLSLFNQSFGFDMGETIKSAEKHLNTPQNCVETRNWDDDDDAEPTITCSEKKNQQGLEQTQQQPQVIQPQMQQQTQEASSSTLSELKKTVAVSRFENKAGISSQMKLGSGMADMLADALIQSGKFVVLERQTLSDVIGEQNLAAGSRAAVSKTAQTGKIIPAQILIKGTVTEFQENTGGGGTGIGFMGFNIQSDSSSAHVAVIIRLVDATSGTIIASKRAEGKAEGGGMRLGVAVGGVSFGGGGFEKTAVGKATQMVIDKAIVEIANSLKNVPIRGKVIKASGSKIYINLGGRNGVSPSTQFDVYEPGEELIDPDTGENLGSESTKRGAIKVSTVKEKFSIAEIISGQGFEKGYWVQE
ncbi:MAG: hypothetical protein NZ820_05555 [Dehalococcoidia bacterium]|nr:hypothetical protein [Dehalococcoidia bacterium]